MTKKIYIDWENQNYYTCFEEVEDYFRFYCEYTEFDDFLAQNYRHETIFAFSEEDRTEVLAKYQALFTKELANWMSEQITVINVN